MTLYSGRLSVFPSNIKAVGSDLLSRGGGNTPPRLGEVVDISVLGKAPLVTYRSRSLAGEVTLKLVRCSRERRPVRVHVAVYVAVFAARRPDNN